MADYPEIVYWLTLINASGLKLNLVKPIIQRWCLIDKRSLADLFEQSPLEWSTTFGLSDHEAEQAAAASAKLSRQAAVLAEWEQQGIEPISCIDARYPKRLIHTLPPAQQPLILWVQGAVNLLNEPGIAILGDETAAKNNTEFIGELMSTLVEEQIGLVSGYGRGLDRASFEATLALDEGWAVVMLPMGLSAFAKTTSVLTDLVAAQRIVLVSPFAPETAYQENLAEARTLLIDHLALALLIPEADEASNERGAAALDWGLPVFVGMNDTAGNRALLDLGALLLTDAGEVIEMVQQAMIDATLLDEAEEELPVAAPAISPVAAPAVDLFDADDNYALHTEEIEPIDSEEALEILSTGGQIPEILRQRLEQSDEEDS